jgi:hypothetical protein
MEEIINKVALALWWSWRLLSKGVRAQIDISQWLLEGFFVEEKDFREQLKIMTGYQDQYVAINCSTLL